MGTTPNKKDSGLKPEQYRGLELLTSHGMKYLPIPYRILFGGSPAEALQACRSIQQDPKQLQGMCQGTALVGVLTGTVDVMVVDAQHPDAESDWTNSVLDQLPKIIAIARNNDGSTLYFTKSAGWPGGTEGALSLLTQGCWVELPGSIRPEDTESHLRWLLPPELAGDDK